MTDPTLIQRDPDRGFRTWSYGDIYLGPDTGVYVPNVGDLVVDFNSGFFRVSEVDFTTNLSTLIPWEPPATSGEGNQNLLLGGGPGSASESFRMFLDTSVTPHTLSPDANLHLYGSLITYYKVFFGTNITEESGEVISQMYDGSGNFLGNQIPMEAVTIPAAPGQSTIKTPVVGYTSRTMQTGEVVTLVCYDAEGNVVTRSQLVVVESSVISQGDATKKFISSISIRSPNLNDSDPTVIEYPINVTVESLPLIGVVRYTDGSVREYPIDGTKFSILGLNDYVATIVGQSIPILISYQLGNDEISQSLIPTANGRLTVPYTVRSLPIDGSYEVKLFVYPVWQNASEGYRLEYWLYSLDRDVFYNATPHVEMGSNSNAFNPTQYGITQTITVAINIEQVHVNLSPYRHVQTFQISLLANGTAAGPSDVWEIFNTPNSGNGYGRGVSADISLVSANNYNLDVSCDQASLELWLQHLYYRTEPLFNSGAETIAPAPTHFRLVVGVNEYEYTINQWDQTLTISSPPNEGELIYIRWIKRVDGTDLQLGISGLPVNDING